MSQYRLETEEDMSAYLDINFGHGVTAVYTVGGSSTTINIIINNEYVEQVEGTGVEALKPIELDYDNLSEELDIDWTIE